MTERKYLEALLRMHGKYDRADFFGGELPYISVSPVPGFTTFHLYNSHPTSVYGYGTGRADQETSDR